MRANLFKQLQKSDQNKAIFQLLMLIDIPKIIVIMYILYHCLTGQALFEQTPCRCPGSICFGIAQTIDNS